MATTKMENLPIVGITLGDIAGIGPEVVVKALRHSEVYAVCRPLVIGDARVPALKALDAETVIHSLYRPGAGDARDGCRQGIDWPTGRPLLLDLHTIDPAQVTVGELSPAAGRAAVAVPVPA